MVYHMAKRFGSTAIDRGFISKDQCAKALEIQAEENREQGKHRLLGKILMDMKLLTQRQIDDVLNTMTLTMSYTLLSGR
jgi:hypothetical protein